MTTKRGMRPLTAAGLSAVLGLAPVTRAQDETIPLDRLPKAVMKVAKARFPGAEIRQASEEAEDGKPIYSLEMKHLRHIVDVSFKANGTVVLVKTSISQKALPRVLLRAIGRQYPGASVKGAEAVTKGPEPKKAVDYYELYLLTAHNRPRRITVDPKGNVLEDPFRRVRSAQPRPALGRSPGPWLSDMEGF